MTKRNKDLPTILTATVIVLLSINPEWTQGSNDINLLLVSAMCVSPAMLLIKGARVVIPRIDIPLGLVCALVVIPSQLFHSESVRWNTMLFTCACCVYFMMFARMVRISRFTGESFMTLVRYLVYAYAGVLLIQQICLICGLPVPLNDGGFLSFAPWKLNSLSAEPSHTTVILSTLMYFYNQTFRATNKGSGLWESIRNAPALWICFVWTIFSTGNSSAFLLGPLSLLPYVTRKNAWKAAGVACAGILLIFLTPAGDLPLVSRLRDTITATATLDDERIIEADESASARIVPTIRGARAIDFSERETYIGYGVDADRKDIAPQPCNKNLDGFAGVFSMWHNYGAVCAVAFWTAIGTVTLIRRRWLSIATFTGAMLLSADHNMQLVWLVMACSAVYKYCVLGDNRLLQTLHSILNRSDAQQEHFPNRLSIHHFNNQGVGKTSSKTKPNAKES